MKNTKSLRDGPVVAASNDVATASKNEKAPHYWYETQERAFAPRIADGWPAVIAAPHSKNGRLVRRQGDPNELLAALKGVVGLIQLIQSREPALVTNHRFMAAEAAIAKAEAK